ncbi:MAG: GNAT family N-acetyltransferase [Balneolaceae bacterium]|nr:GNAT family N-acetyltransferase [Balneolaceae bacterium]
MNQPTLHTDRLLLRPFASEDAEEIQALASDRAIAEGTFIPHPYKDGVAEEYIRTVQEGWQEDNLAIFAVTITEDRNLVGTVGLKDIDDHHNRAELGYWIGKPYWGNGFATEAAAALLDFGFRELSLHRIYAFHFHTNPQSGRVLKKIGMKKEGALRKHIYRLDKYRDMIAYGILRSEWNAPGR